MSPSRYLTVLILACCYTTRVSAIEVTFDELFSHPERFNDQIVTVTGLLEVAGDDNYLWRDVASRQRENTDTLIMVVPDLNKRYPGTNMSADQPANFKWVKLTGTVDTSFHGRFGMDRFGLIEKQINVLPRPREKQFLTILAWFKNDSGHEIHMDIKSLGQETTFEMSPGEVTCAGMDRDNGTAEAQKVSEKTFARCQLTPPGTDNYYDGRNRYYYFRVLRDRIEPVLPAEAKHWKSVEMPDRD